MPTATIHLVSSRSEAYFQCTYKSVLRLCVTPRVYFSCGVIFCYSDPDCEWSRIADFAAWESSSARDAQPWDALHCGGNETPHAWGLYPDLQFSYLEYVWKAPTCIIAKDCHRFRLNWIGFVHNFWQQNWSIFRRDEKWFILRVSNKRWHQLGRCVLLTPIGSSCLQVVLLYIFWT